MNGDVVLVKQYSLPLLGNQRKEMNIIRSTTIHLKVCVLQIM